ncbi:hypothetical protein [uncultured Maribacter sp.]|uniref:hypothetical protein n=1 Tax=uncultured Maribacter sp. TaxID=431308 RepID=UPI0030DD5D6B|tara:strand:- start:116 stop:1027 length:912 start_codon:yes stop_codon:yes gene_type:complete
MNILKSLLLIALIACFVSCSKSSSDPEEDTTISEIDKKANLLATGDSANDILSNENFDKMLIEIAYVTGFKPTESAMTQFMDYLKEHTFKTDIQLVYKELSSPVEDELTLQEIADLETKNRTAYNSGSTLAIYIYFADAPAEGDDLEGGLVTLGAVYRNTSMIIHEVTIKQLAARSNLISDADVETTTLNHEFGHLFGLVNLGTDMVNDHESQSENSGGELAGDNHCNQSGCLMRAELLFGGSSGKSIRANSIAKYEAGIKAGCTLSGNSVLKLLQHTASKSNAAVVGLDPECILDIRANGGR